MGWGPCVAGRASAWRICATSPPRAAPAPRISKDWVIAGGVLGWGWVVGAAMGLGLTVVVMQQVRAPWLMPVLFFHPPVLCLVLGGFTGRGLRAPAAQRTGK